MMNAPLNRLAPELVRARRGSVFCLLMNDERSTALPHCLFTMLWRALVARSHILRRRREWRLKCLLQGNA